MGKAAKIGATLIIVILILGMAYHLYQLYYATQNITVQAISVDNIELEGLNPPLDLIPNAINFRFKVLVDNPSPYSVEIERLQYMVYIEERYLGDGFKEDIYIASHATTPVYLSFRATTSDILRIVGDLIKRGDTAIDYSIKGFIRIPVKLFGIIKLLSVDTPFEKKGYYVIPIQLPSAKPTIRAINAYWSKTQIRLGESAQAIVEIKDGISGTINVIIMKDIPLWPDSQVFTRSFSISVPSGYSKRLTVTFYPKEPSSWKLRGYYIVIELNGEKVWIQPKGYPPRLKVVE